ncbi:hypothetical protein GNI_033830 [Gregarina niphandrodes]|uniref:14-3-3 domain-containing protein n=1 Tax=Gregarina niphandrodes TaxID=110365 RepID=A0A023BB36_GRENI|nr:hypothetical protein GNI_033830 [Gregarina niphandrodes]EZG78628.1 hypothetical protein GNI_033830 [Gregarina niphandrodes]|eukprot:XP_011129219.1 hypothetical protein GNI_033830 [Gregarina niphandrodes]
MEVVWLRDWGVGDWGVVGLRVVGLAVCLRDGAVWLWEGVVGCVVRCYELRDLRIGIYTVGPENYREYWIYKAKIAVLSERYEEAVQYCKKASEHTRQSESENKDYKTFVRSIDRAAKELRFQQHQAHAFRTSRSVETAEAFGRKAEQLEEEAQRGLHRVCQSGLEIINNLLSGDYSEKSEARRALKSLQGDMHRYLGDEAAAQRCYDDALAGDKVNTHAFNAAHLGNTLITPKEKRPGLKIPQVSRPIKHCELPLLPIKLNIGEDNEREARLRLPFSEAEWEPIRPAQIV